MSEKTGLFCDKHFQQKQRKSFVTTFDRIIDAVFTCCHALHINDTSCFYLFLENALELPVSNPFCLFKSFNKIGINYKAALPMMLLICPFENLNAYNFLV